MLLIWIAATQYKKHYPYQEAKRPRLVELDDEDWLLLHVTGQWW